MPYMPISLSWGPGVCRVPLMLSNVRAGAGPLLLQLAGRQDVGCMPAALRSRLLLLLGMAGGLAGAVYWGGALTRMVQKHGYEVGAGVGRRSMHAGRACVASAVLLLEGGRHAGWLVRHAQWLSWTRASYLAERVTPGGGALHPESSRQARSGVPVC